MDMMQIKAIVYGRVQRVGYRDRVAEIARQLQIKGSVNNLGDEVSVRIIAEGEKIKVVLKNFKEETFGRFDRVDEKYGKISERLETISNSLQELVEILKAFRVN